MSDLGSGAWNEVDNSNNSAAPNGWPPGMLGSQVEPTGRAMMGALKRAYTHGNAIHTTAGTNTAYIVTTGGAEAAYYNGQLYSFVVNATCGDAPSLNWDGLGAANFRKFTNAGTWATLSAGDLLANQPVTARYNSSGGGTFDILSMSLSLQDILAAIAAAFVPARSALAGLTLSTAGSSSTFSVAAGQATDSTNASYLTLASSLSKTAGSWAVGTGQGSLDTGTIGTNTWYHAYLIERTDTGVVDVLTSLSASSPTLPTDYTLFRRLGSMKTDGSGNWTAFLQYGDRFLWKSPPTDQNPASVGATAANYTLTVPTGLSVVALVRILGIGYGTYAIYSPNQTVETVGTEAAPGNLVAVVGVTGNAAGANYEIITDTSGHIAAVCDSGGAGQLYMTTDGWIDSRGRTS